VGGVGLCEGGGVCKLGRVEKKWVGVAGGGGSSGWTF